MDDSFRKGAEMLAWINNLLARKGDSQQGTPQLEQTSPQQPHEPTGTMNTKMDSEKTSGKPEEQQPPTLAGPGSTQPSHKRAATVTSPSASREASKRIRIEKLLEAQNSSIGGKAGAEKAVEPPREQEIDSSDEDSASDAGFTIQSRRLTAKSSTTTTASPSIPFPGSTKQQLKPARPTAKPLSNPLPRKSNTPSKNTSTRTASEKESPGVERQKIYEQLKATGGKVPTAQEKEAFIQDFMRMKNAQRDAQKEARKKKTATPSKDLPNPATTVALVSNQTEDTNTVIIQPEQLASHRDRKAATATTSLTAKSSSYVPIVRSTKSKPFIEDSSDDETATAKPAATAKAPQVSVKEEEKHNHGAPDPLLPGVDPFLDSGAASEDFKPQIAARVRNGEKQFRPVLTAFEASKNAATVNKEVEEPGVKHEVKADVEMEDAESMPDGMSDMPGGDVERSVASSGPGDVGPETWCSADDKIGTVSSLPDLYSHEDHPAQSQNRGSQQQRDEGALTPRKIISIETIPFPTARVTNMVSRQPAPVAEGENQQRAHVANMSSTQQPSISATNSVLPQSTLMTGNETQQRMSVADTIPLVKGEVDFVDDSAYGTLSDGSRVNSSIEGIEHADVEFPGLFVSPVPEERAQTREVDEDDDDDDENETDDGTEDEDDSDEEGDSDEDPDREPDEAESSQVHRQELRAQRLERLTWHKITAGKTIVPFPDYRTATYNPSASSQMTQPPAGQTRGLHLPGWRQDREERLGPNAAIQTAGPAAFRRNLSPRRALSQVQDVGQDARKRGVTTSGEVSAADVSHNHQRSDGHPTVGGKTISPALMTQLLNHIRSTGSDEEKEANADEEETEDLEPYMEPAHYLSKSDTSCFIYQVHLQQWDEPSELDEDRETVICGRYWSLSDANAAACEELARPLGSSSALSSPRGSTSWDEDKHGMKTFTFESSSGHVVKTWVTRYVHVLRPRDGVEKREVLCMPKRVFEVWQRTTVVSGEEGKRQKTVTEERLGSQWYATMDLANKAAGQRMVELLGKPDSRRMDDIEKTVEVRQEVNRTLDKFKQNGEPLSVEVELDGGARTVDVEVKEVEITGPRNL